MADPRPRPWHPWPCAALFTLACGGGPSGTASAPDLVAADMPADAAEAVELPPRRPAPWQLARVGVSFALSRGDQAGARLTALQAGVVPADDYDPSGAFFYDPHDDQWHAVAFQTLAACGPAAEGALPVGFAGGCQGTLGWEEPVPGRFTFELAFPDPVPWRLVNLRLVFDAPAGEHYYGLGELFDHPEHRGRRRAMHFEIDAESEGGYNEAHVPVPLLVATTGWGLFVEDRHPGDFDVAASQPDAVRVTYEATSLRFHLLTGEHPYDVLAGYTALTGAPAAPPEWAFGGHVWRDENKDQAEVLADAHAARANDLALSALWIDRPWQTTYNSFRMNPARFPDPEGLVAELHALGFRLVFWSTPYLHPDLGEVWENAQSSGYFVEKPNGFPKPWGADMLDLTNPGAVALFETLIGRATSLGAEGFKLDYGEDIQVGALGAALPFGFHNGETERTMHHGYPLYYHAPYAKLTRVPAGQGFILSRAGTYGDQTLTTTVWPGDLCNTFHRHREDGHVGGLPAAIAGGLSLASSGYPFYASDTGGYRHGRATKQVFLRWLAYSALGSVMQIGGGLQHLPWDFAPYDDGHGGTSQFDQETLDISRDFFRLHARLHAYRAPWVERAKAQGAPVTAPLGLRHPELGQHPGHVFLLGDDLLVAPVLDASGKAEVVLPAGTWYDFWTDAAVAGPATFTLDVPLDRAALYVREGAILPLLRGDLDTLAPATDPGVVSLANQPGELTVRLYPGATAPRTFTTLGGTAITRDGNKVALSGSYFSGYVLEVHGVAGGVRTTRVGAGARTLELP